MNNRLFLVLACSFLTTIAFGQTETNQLPEDNPLKYKSSLPYQAIPFDKLKDEHYRPALLEGLRLELEEVTRIANNPAPPSFENTVLQ